MSEVVKKSEISLGSLGFSGTLFIVFLILKLCGVISWSWWWVTAPLWGGIALLLAIIIISILVLFIISKIAKLKRKTFNYKKI